MLVLTDTLSPAVAGASFWEGGEVYLTEFPLWKCGSVTIKFKVASSGSCNLSPTRLPPIFFFTSQVKNKSTTIFYPRRCGVWMWICIMDLLPDLIQTH